MLGWHFLQEDRRLSYDDGRHVRVGRTLKVGGEPEVGVRGLHASARIMDALGCAPGSVICRVQLGGTIVRRDDKAAATERTVLWWVNGKPILHEFACRVAAIALTAAKLEDPRCWAAIETKRRWLRGKATGAELDAARADARAARDDANANASLIVRNAANAVVWATFRSTVCAAANTNAVADYAAADYAVRNAANAVVWATASASASAAASAAARTVASGAARAQFGRILTGMVVAEHRREQR